jgi:D-aminoacyl-tRNA deacylase
MICILQRVLSSKVTIDNQKVSSIEKGFNILLGVFKGDTKENVQKLVSKIVDFRVFNDSKDKMNLSIRDISGSALVVSQFTLAGSIKKGRRPSFELAEEPSKAENLYDYFCLELANYIKVEKGVFGENMLVDIQNDGPVTFILDTDKL